MKILVLIVFLLCIAVEAQVAPRQVGVERDVLLQPLALQVSRLGNALKFLGQPLSDEKKRQLAEAIGNGDESAAARGIEAALDPLVLAVVDINAESRVKVQHGAAEPELVQGGARFFLVKVLNRAHITSRLVVDSKNSLPIFVRSNGSPTPPVELTATDVRDRWAEISIYGKPPMEERLSGVGLEYLILEVYSRDSGQRAAEISFNVGQGSQDIGFRNDILVVFHALPSHTIKLHVLDENYQPTMASFTIRDQHGRLYPNPSKRLAPDFFSRRFTASTGKPLICRPAATRWKWEAGQSILSKAGKSMSLPTLRGSLVSNWSGGLIPPVTGGTPAITTFMPPAALTIRIRQRASCPKIWGARSKGRSST